jgi:hypothetical protein
MPTRREIQAECLAGVKRKAPAVGPGLSQVSAAVPCHLGRTRYAGQNYSRECAQAARGEQRSSSRMANALSCQHRLRECFGHGSKILWDAEAAAILSEHFVSARNAEFGELHIALGV